MIYTKNYLDHQPALTKEVVQLMGAGQHGVGDVNGYLVFNNYSDG